MPIYKMEGKKDGLQKYRVRINYTDSTGKNKQIDRVAYGKEEAKELERKLCLNLKEETAPTITFKELYDEYMEMHSHEVRESTMRAIRGRIELYVMPDFGKHQVDKINIRMLQKWKNDMEKRRTTNKKENSTLSLNTKQHTYTDFNSILEFAVKMEYLQKNPMKNLGNFRDAYSGKEEMNFYTFDEFKSFINIAHNCAVQSEFETKSIYEWNFYVFFMIAFYTGLRKGEIYALRWTDITDNKISVTKSITQKLKGDDRETPPKNKRSIRTIQIPDPLQKIIDEHYNRYKKIEDFSDSWHICGGEKCIRDTTLQKKNIKYSSEAKVKNIRIHDFRHSHASLLANNGINIQEIARRLGHTNIEVTWNTYAHLYPQEEERAIQVLNKFV